MKNLFPLWLQLWVLVQTSADAFLPRIHEVHKVLCGFFFLNFTMDSIYQITRFISNTTITCIGFRVGLTPLKTSSSWTWPCPTWQALALLLDPAIIFIIIIYWTLQWTNFTKCKICLLHLGCNFLTKCIFLLHARMTIDNYLAYCYATFLCSLDVEV